MRDARYVRVALLGVLGALGLASSAWAAGNFGYRKAITLSGVVGGPHSSFPVLISLVDPDLQARVASPSGHDIVFRGEDPATCGGPPTCSLDHEIERWDGNTGTLVAWVRVPALAPGTVIYMYYGDGRLSSSTAAGRAVWDADYVGVWHLKEDHNVAVNGYRDSSRYGNHGHGGRGDLLASPQPVVDGGVGFGQRFDNADGTYDFINGGDDGTLHVAGDQITLQAWVRHDITIDAPHGTPPSVSNAYGILNHKGYYDGYSLWLEGASTFCPGGAITRPCLTFNLPGSIDQIKTPPTASLGPNQWHHVIATYDGATMNVFVDGVNEGSRAKTGNVAPSTGDQSMWIGHGDQPDNRAWSAQFEGDLDEIRISRVARSADWITTEFANQSAPAAFHGVGPEVPGTYPLGTLSVNYRSIGVAGTLYSTGAASVALGDTTVTFGGGASLPGAVRRGDALVFTGPPVETLYILSRDSATQVTVQDPATAAHAAQPYAITRAFSSLVAWEAAREGDLVRDNRRETGIVYEGPLPGGLTFSGSNTDPVRSMVLTAAPAFRHQGRAGTGAVIDNGAGAAPAIRILDDHVTVEWLEIKGGPPAPAHGIAFANGLDPVNLGTVRYNIIHDLGGAGIRLGDPDAIVDLYGNIIYETEYGIHLPVDLTPAARVNVFSNTIYGANGAPGPSGIKSDVRQTSVRVDLRDNIAHSNANGDFGVSPFFDWGWFCNPVCQQIGNGGVLGPLEQLADRTNVFPLPFANVGTDCLYLGSSTPFRGVSVFLEPPGAPAGADLQWDYWNGAWVSLEGSFADGTGHLGWTGAVYWPDDPAGWVPTPVNGSPALFYVRACLAAGAYTTVPTEKQITRIDVGMASRNNLSSDVTGRPHSVLWGGSQGYDLVPLPAMAFSNVTPGAEDLHINVGSAAENVGVGLDHRFSADIDGALWVDPWDIGADEASMSSGPDLSITKDDGQPTAVPGTPVAYTITITNNGPGLLTSATVLDAVPPEIRGPLFAPSVGVFDPGSGVWAGLDLGPSQSATLTLQGTIAPWARGTLVNQAEVKPPAGVDDTNSSNNAASDLDTLTPSADLALTKTDDVDPAEIGGLLTYALTLSNNGPSDATGVVVTDTLIPEMEFDSATWSQGLCSYDGPTRVLTCPLGGVAAGAGATVTLTVRPMDLGTFTNSASVGGIEADPVSGNNSATELTTVQATSFGVRFFTVTSTSETNVLEWLNPVADYDSTEIVFRTDRFPTAPGEPGSTSLYDAGAAGAKDRFVHDTGAGSNDQTHYYGAFVHRTAAPFLSPGRFCSGRPFDNSGPVKWAFSTGIFSITPPTVGGVGVVAPANDNALYAMERGPAGGEWPTGWLPVQLGGAVQSRSPVVPIPVGVANPVVYLGAQDGNVYVVNGTQGGAAGFPWAPRSIAGVVQAAPAGIFTAWGGGVNYLLVGTRDGADNALVALDPATGAVIDSFDNGGSPTGIGIINGMATVDYANQRVYFASHENAAGSPGTLWCLRLGPPGPVFTLLWQRPLGDMSSSPVLRGDRIYVGSTLGGGTVYSIDAATGNFLFDRTFVHGDGPVKDFMWPDRSSPDLYFATNTRVWGVSDTGAPNMPAKFPGISLGGGATPSAVLFVPGNHYVYVGGSNGELHEIDVLGPTLKSEVLGDGLALVGAPSLDWFYSLIHVGSEAGIFYAVDVPLP